jgi:peroxiredoxin
MRKTVFGLLPFVVLSMTFVAYSQLQVPGADNTPKLGEKPPDVELSQGRGGSLGMKDFAGKKKVLLAFFPMAFTAG